YISGEEAVAQIRLRAERLGVAAAPVALAAETSVGDILATLAEDKATALLISHRFSSVRMADLIAVADAGEIMAPKSPWFEPKLADGVTSHVLD
ncbi:MAG TPA: hypothetical protein PKA74_11010, partial [Bauldia sp.]|nr:hypothetical protein [Bauldia sp.]